MSVEILEKGEVRGGGKYIKVQVSDHKALMDYKFDAGVVVDVMASRSISMEERQKIKDVCKSKWYNFVEVVKELNTVAGALASDDGEVGPKK